jgi:hypothetical protein
MVMTSEKILFEAKMSDTVLFDTLNTNNTLQTNLINGVKTGKVLTKEHILEQLLQIKRTNISPLTSTVIRAFENGDIKIIYADPSISITSALPFFTTRSNGKIVTFIFANRFGTLSKNNETGEESLNISFKDLYALMEGAFTANSYVKNPSLITSNIGLMKCCCDIYSELFIHIINKECSIANDPELFNKVIFLIGYFFLNNVWESDNKNINIASAKRLIKSQVDADDILTVVDEYEAADIKNLKDFILFLENISPKMKLLKIRKFIQYYINLYKAPSVFGLECLQYFLFTVQTTMIGSFIVNQPLISNNIKRSKEIKVFYPELTKILKSRF